jgi:hypothetical protein
VKYFLEDSLAHDRSVIILTGALSSASVHVIRLLANMLTGFDVTVVYEYRELLSHTVSWSFEQNRFEHDYVDFAGSFSTHLVSIPDDVTPILDPAPLLRDYSEVFGRYSIQVIDLAGCAAGDHDVTYVLVCEVAGVLCNRPELFENAALGSNAGYGLVPAEAFSFYKGYVEQQRCETCKFCGRLYAAYYYFAKTLQADVSRGIAPALHTNQSRLGVLVPFSQKMDSTLRAQWGDKILRGNAFAVQS